MKYLAILLTFFISASLGFSQEKSSRPAANPIPKLSLKWANQAGGKLTIAQVQQMVDSPLVVRDDKGARLRITSFRINYWFRSSYKDEETQQTKNVRDFRSKDFFDSDRLSEDWSASIKDNVKPGDEMLLNKVVVRLSNGKSYTAPELKVVVVE